MAAVLGFPSHFPSPPSASLSRDPNGGSGLERGGGGGGGGGEEREEEDREEDQLSLLALLLTLLRKSLVGCRPGREEGLGSMEIGWPTEVQHVAHVTFDRFHGFLGLPSEFEPEVPRRAPSASATVFGVSTESMQCSFDSRGNSVPTILLQMQRSLYANGGLQAEGIFRITAGNSQEEYVREQLNRGIVPDGIDVHCLAGLIKAWFRELPTGVLDSLSPEQVMQCQSEDECVQLVKCLPPAEASLMNWAINLMTDVVQEEQRNKMNSHNVAMVFAPNMTQMADPLTALMYAVRVMNFLKMLIERARKEREETMLEVASISHPEPSDENDDQGPHLHLEACSEDETEQAFIPKEPNLGSPTQLSEENSTADGLSDSSQASGDDSSVSEGTTNSIDEDCLNIPAGNDCSAASASKPDISLDKFKKVGQVPFAWRRVGQSGNLNFQKGAKRVQSPSAIPAMMLDEKSRSIAKANCIDSKVERLEAWR